MCGPPSDQEYSASFKILFHLPCIWKVSPVWFAVHMKGLIEQNSKCQTMFQRPKILIIVKPAKHFIHKIVNVCSPVIWLNIQCKCESVADWNRAHSQFLLSRQIKIGFVTHLHLTYLLFLCFPCLHHFEFTNDENGEKGPVVAVTFYLPPSFILLCNSA